MGRATAQRGMMTRTKMPALGILMAAISLAMLSADCSFDARHASSNSSATATPADAQGAGVASYSSDELADAYPASGPSLSGSILVVNAPQTLAQLVRKSTLIAVVEPQSKLPDAWSAHDTSVRSQFRARVVRVFRGEARPGDIITLHVPGGTMAASSGPTRSQEPVEGERVRVLEYVDYPFYNSGIQELVFLHRDYNDGDSYGATFGPASRYNVVDGKLRSIYPPGLAPSISDGTAVRVEVEGKTLDELAALVGGQSGWRPMMMSRSSR